MLDASSASANGVHSRPAPHPTLSPEYEGEGRILRLMPNLKVLKLINRRRRLHVHISDKPRHLPLDLIDDAVGFPIGAFHHQFDTAVVEIADEAADFVLLGDIAGGVAESDALHAAGEV